MFNVYIINIYFYINIVNLSWKLNLNLTIDNRNVIIFHLHISYIYYHIY